MTKHTKKIIGISAGSAALAGGLGWWYLATHPAQSETPSGSSSGSTTTTQTSTSPGPTSTESVSSLGYTTNQTVETPSATSAVLTWTAASGATSYQLINVGTGQTLGTTSSTTYTLSGLTPGASYRVSIVGCNSAGCMGSAHQGSVTWTQPIAVDNANHTQTFQATTAGQTHVVVSTEVPSGASYAAPSQSQINTLASIQTGTFTEPTVTAQESALNAAQAYLLAHPSMIQMGYRNSFNYEGTTYYYSAEMTNGAPDVYSIGTTESSVYGGYTG